MKNKKRLLITFTSITIATTIAMSLFFQFDTNGFFGEQNSVLTSGAFNLDSDSIHEKGDSIYEAQLASGTSKVDVLITNASLPNKNVVIGEEEYITISNLESSPIRGINYINFSGSASSDGSIIGAIYYSYHHLDIEDIFDGKYQDLVTVSFNEEFSSGVAFDLLTNTEIESQSQARYFLALIGSTKEFTISSITVDSICQDEPEDIGEIGTYSDYPSNIKNVLHEDFPFIGNGSFSAHTEKHLGYGLDWFIEQPWAVFTMIQPSGNKTDFSNELEQNGFIYLDTYLNREVYQHDVKNDDDTFYSVHIEPLYSFGGYDYFSTKYVGLQGNVATEYLDSACNYQQANANYADMFNYEKRSQYLDYYQYDECDLLFSQRDADPAFTYIFGDPATIDEVVDAFLNNVLSQENIYYSEYEQRYISRDSNISLAICKCMRKAFECTLIHIDFNEEHFDYQYLNEFQVANFQYLNLFPEMPNTRSYADLYDDFNELGISCTPTVAEIYAETLLDVGFIDYPNYEYSIPGFEYIVHEYRFTLDSGNILEVEIWPQMPHYYLPTFMSFDRLEFRVIVGGQSHLSNFV